MSAGGDGHGGTKAVIAALLANLAIAVAKLFGWFITTSSAMLAEAMDRLERFVTSYREGDHTPA